MEFVFFLISFISSIIGAISGIGGGIIIKPILDATSDLSIGTIGFLSGCTVLSMSAVSLLRSRKSRISIDIGCSSFLAVGGILGGIAGNGIFQLAEEFIGNDASIGMIQSGLLLLMTLFVFLYISQKSRIHTHYIAGFLPRILIGIGLGAISAFLGIGGGPMNIVVLYFFFSMDAKSAAINSLYIIFFSQLANLVTTIAGNTVPLFEWPVLLLMILGGVFGALLGSRIVKRFKVHHTEKFFIALLFVIAGINLYNLIRFSGLFL